MTNTDTRMKYEKLVKLLTKVKANHNRKNKYKLSHTTIQLIERRKNLLSKHPRKDNLKTITKLSKEISANIRKDRKTMRMQTLERHIAKTGRVKKALKELIEINKEWIPN
ncbi:unnamed protein product [Parnassius apollo]|uniref:(apollo) hypothetical protein n=1 Tax=Parnassius apollo TaxID=110799 RepID=A0A8S3W1K6_PARAO|nr:unnamed protein product [Parnassius apollo]